MLAHSETSAPQVVRDPRDEVHAQSVRSIQLGQLYAQLPLGLAAGLFNATMVGWVLTKIADARLLDAWYVATIAVCLVRWVSYRQFLKHDPATRDYTYWRTIFACGVFAAGALWGVAASLLVPAGQMQHHAFVGFVLAGMAAGASASMSAHSKIYTAYIILLVVPFALRLVFEGGPMALAICSMSFAFLAMLTLSAKRNAEMLYQALLFRQQKDSLAQELSTKARELELANEALIAENLGKQETEKALILAKTVAEEAVKTKTLFLANMSHEIRTPMNGVFGMTDLLMRTNLDARQTKLVKTVNESAKSLLTIINDILDLSRIEAGRLELDCHEFGIRELMERSVDLFAGQAHGKGLELSLFMSNDLPNYLKGDSGRLKQVLLNILSNALKFTTRGEIAIRATCAEQTAHSTKIAIEIRDTGIGIDSVTAGKLFQPFSQGETSISRRYGGTGLGLSISRHLIDLMGGSITLDSELGRGTRVTIHVTLENAVSAAQNEQDYAALEGARIIVIDDRETNRDIVCTYLEGCGSKTMRAVSTFEAYPLIEQAAARGKPFHAAVVDMIMPGENGLEFATKIKADPAVAGLKIIIATSLNWQGDIAAVRDAGIETVLHKPVRRHELIDSVARAVTGTRHPGWRGTIPTPRSGPQPAENSRSPLSANILLAEDNPVNVEVAREFLTGLGCRVFVVNNGLEAVAALSSSAYDLVLMDCQMPIMDGLTATRRIRAIESESRSRRTPIVAVTANAFAEDRARCIDAGMNDYLSKPFSEKALYEVLLTWLNSGSATAPSRRKTSAMPDRADMGVSSDQAEVLDQAVIAPLKKARPDLLQRLVTTYLAYAPKAIADLNAAAATTDFAQLSALAHSLKSSSANLGAANIASCCRQLERTAAEKQTVESVRLVEEITRSFDNLRAALSREIAEVESALKQPSRTG